MNTDVIATLIKKTVSGKDECGNAIYAEMKNTVFAERKSVRQTEFYQAAAVGFKPEIMLEVYAFEYGGEELCELDGERYRIYRTFAKPGTDRVELYLTAIVGDTNAFA